MENCLITKLKGTVNNDNLDVLNEVIMTWKGQAGSGYIPLVAPTGKTLHLIATSGTIVSVGASSTKISDTEAIIGTTGGLFTTANGLLTCKVSNKYDINAIISSCTSIRGGITKMEYNQFSSVELTNYTDTLKLSDFSEINLANCVGIACPNSAVGNISGTANDILSKCSTEVFKAFNISAYKVNASILDFAQFTAMTRIGINSIGTVSSPDTVESFVVSQRNNGRSSCTSLHLHVYSGTITFNDVALSTGGLSDHTISWEPNASDATKTDITCDGTTITV